MSVQDKYKGYLSDQREFFNELITTEWDTYHSEDWDATRQFEIERIFARVKPETILDIGCGCGFHDQAMAKRDFVRRIDAFDYSNASVERAEKSYPHPKVRRFVGDIATFESEEGYDLVASFQVFEHLDTPSVYFDCLRRTCKAGGWAVIVMPHRNRLPNALRRLKGLPDELCDPQHFREYTIAETHRLAAANGFAPAGGFSYGIDPVSVFKGFPHRRRLHLGGLFKNIASGIGVFVRAPA